MLEMYVDDLLVVYDVKVCKGNEAPDGQLNKGNKWQQTNQMKRRKEAIVVFPVQNIQHHGCLVRKPSIYLN